MQELIDIGVNLTGSSFRKDLDDVIKRAQELNKGVIIKKGLQSGHADKSVGGSGVEEAFKYVL